MLDLSPPNDLIIGRMTVSNSNRFVEVLEAALAITSSPTFEDAASPQSFTCTMRSKPILRRRPSMRPTKSSTYRPQAQQKQVQFSDVVAGTIVASLDAEEKRCIWYCVSIAYFGIFLRSFLVTPYVTPT